MAIELDTTQLYDARIRVVGVGGGGGNAIRTMITRGLEGVEFIAANTDHQALMNNPAGTKIQLGKNITRGLGAGANPDVGRKAVEESLDDVRDALDGSDMIFVTAGMGGGTGTGAAPVIARIGREQGALVVGIVTKPFSYESKRRNLIAEQGIKELREHVDALIVIPNQRILTIVDRHVSFIDALAMVDNVLYNATKGIADIISGVGYVNVDFADVRTVMSSAGDALMGIGQARGEHRALEAATNALNSPILEGMSIYGALGLLVNITGGHSMTMHEVSEAVSAIEKAAGDEVNLIHGIVLDERMEDEIAITVVATGFRRQEEVSKSPKVTILPVKKEYDEASASAINVVADPAPLPRITIVQERQSTPATQKPYSPVDLEHYDEPAYVRKQRQNEQQQQQQGSPGMQAGGNGMQAGANGMQAGANGMQASAEPNGYPLPARKTAQGAGGNTPAFLRKIMD